ncbi:hypothetical protein AB0A95_30580 [Micromonospora sp. NPDC049230]|uniref:hypothetical protein n=1 Tax=Micromonospora sp. NPDC049230 TaxID=3155502 RepID=UPI00340BEC52
MATIPRSLTHRIIRRRLSRFVWGSVPVLSPFEQRLRLAALGDHVCQARTVTP